MTHKSHQQIHSSVFRVQTNPEARNSQAAGPILIDMLAQTLAPALLQQNNHNNCIRNACAGLGGDRYCFPFLLALYQAGTF